MSEPKHVLYVEDNLHDVYLVRQALLERAVNAQLHVVENAVRAFAFLAKQGDYVGKPTPDLVILDLNLPIITGVRTLSVIRTASEWAGVPVAVLTSSERAEDRSMCTRLGVVAYHVKPNVWDEYLALADLLTSALESGCVATKA